METINDLQVVIDRKKREGREGEKMDKDGWKERVKREVFGEERCVRGREGDGGEGEVEERKEGRWEVG